MKFLSKSVRQTLVMGRKISAGLNKGDIVCLFGELGAGKTVLAKGIAAGLGIDKKRIVSPTFVLIREYKAKNNIPVYHFDLYRLDSSRDIAGLGYEEFFYNDAISLIEWPDKLGQLLPQEYLKVNLAIKGKTRRLIEISCQGSRYEKLIEDIREDIRH